MRHMHVYTCAHAQAGPRRSARQTVACTHVGGGARTCRSVSPSCFSRYARPSSSSVCESCTTPRRPPTPPALPPTLRRARSDALAPCRGASRAPALAGRCGARTATPVACCCGNARTGPAARLGDRRPAVPKGRGCRLTCAAASSRLLLVLPMLAPLDVRTRVPPPPPPPPALAPPSCEPLPLPPRGGVRERAPLLASGLPPPLPLLLLRGLAAGRDGDEAPVGDDTEAGRRGDAAVDPVAQSSSLAPPPPPPPNPPSPSLSALSPPSPPRPSLPWLAAAAAAPACRSASTAANRCLPRARRCADSSFSVFTFGMRREVEERSCDSADSEPLPAPPPPPPPPPPAPAPVAPSDADGAGSVVDSPRRCAEALGPVAPACGNLSSNRFGPADALCKRAAALFCCCCTRSVRRRTWASSA